MKITCISTSQVPSESANSIQLMKVSQALAQLGHSVHLLVPGREAATWDMLAEWYGLSQPFEITWLPSSPYLRRIDFAWLAVRVARKLESDLVYTWTGQAAVFALLHRIPVILEAHDLPTGMLGPWWMRGFLRLPGRRRLAVITRALSTALESRLGNIIRSEVVIAPNGVELEQYENLPQAPQARRDLGLPDGPTVSCSGHLYAGRGVDLFLNLAGQFPGVNFLWVGGRPEDVDLYRAKAATAGLQNVTFTGFIAQQRLPRYQAAADVLLMPYAHSIAGSGGGNSADICSPMKMFDYLAAGRAILASDLPVIHEVLNESNAVFASPEDLSGWTKALGTLLSDHDRRERLADQSCRDAGAYSWRERSRRVLDGFLK